MGLNPPTSGSGALKQRFFFLSLAATFIFIILLGRLWYLQVIKTEEYSQQSERNRTRYIPIEPPRGSIYDRNGELLVENRPSYGVAVIRQEVGKPESLLLHLNALLGVPYAELQRKFELTRRYPPYQPAPLINDIERDKMELLMEQGGGFPGVVLKVLPVRTYSHGETGAHLFGYIGEIAEKDLQDPRYSGYRPGDMVGKTGLEKHLENYLHGTSGERRVEVDVHGRELRQLTGVEATPGKKVYLTIDVNLQRVAEEAFGEETGAAVVLDVNTGEVLAMVSRPTFDPALFSGGITAKEWKGLVEDPLKPLQNRAIQGQYPPGSTFKLVTALAALREGAAGSGTVVNCSGSITLGKNNQIIRCWNKKGHGTVDLRRAIKESCDVWFYQVGLKLGIEKLAKTAFDMGMGQVTGIPLDGEKKGLIPTKEWKKRRFNQGWFNGETAIAAIGQGYVLATPLQLASMTATVANGGKVYRPHVVKEVMELDGTEIFKATPEETATFDIPPSLFAPVREGMEAVVSEAGGTAAASRLRGVRIAGKTGTAQVIKNKAVKSANDPREERDHALFVAYAPVENPKIALAIIVEHGGHGGSAAAPIARAIFANYFGLEDQLPLPKVATPTAVGVEDQERPPETLPEEIEPTPIPPLDDPMPQNPPEGTERL